MDASIDPVRRAAQLLRGTQLRRATAIATLVLLVTAVGSNGGPAAVAAALLQSAGQPVGDQVPTPASSASMTPAAVAAAIAAVTKTSAVAESTPAPLGRVPDSGTAARVSDSVLARSAGSDPTRVQPDPLAAAYGTAPVSFISDVVFTAPVNCGSHDCQLALDVWVPTGPGPYPTVVLIRGGPSGFGGRLGLGYFASQLASAGMLVYNADYRDIASEGGGYPAAFQDVACAIRYARATAPGLGGDGVVTLVGHSLGGWIGSVVALDPNEFQGGCLYDGSGRPDAFVGLAGNYDLQYNQNDLYRFFGAGPDETAAARTASNPFTYATGAPIPVRLVAGTDDGTVYPNDSVELDSFLVGKGWNVGLTLVPGGTHMSLLDSSEDSPTSLSMIYEVMQATRDTADAIDPVKARQGE